MSESVVSIRKKEINVSIKEIAFIALFIFANILSSKIRYLGAILSLMEVTYIGVCVISGKINKAFNAILLCVSCSLEMSSFVYYLGVGHALYSVYNVPALSIFPFYGLTYAMFLIACFKYSKKPKEKNKDTRAISTFLRFLPILFFSGLVIGMIAILVNDNGIAAYSWSYTALFTNSLRILSLFSFIGTVAFLLKENDSYRKELESLIVELLFGMVIVFSVTILLGWHGYYGELTNLMLMPLAASICPILVLFPSYYKVKYPYMYYLFAIIFTVEAMFYNSLMGSKFYVIPLACASIFVIITVKKGRIKAIALTIIALLFVLVNYENILGLITDTGYGNWKYNQFINVFSNSGGGIMNWYYSVDDSPRFRIDEFVNIFFEYVRKPWYALLGKGNAGSILHTWGTTDWNHRGGTFADYQIDSGIYMSMHESINVIFLRHGILGLIFIISTFINAGKKLVRSPWAIGGIIWFVFYWGIYISWWMGAAMLVMALSYTNDNFISKEVE